LGCNEVADVIELDRQRGMKVAKMVGMTIPDTIDCAGVDEARAIEWENEFGYVIKPTGNLHTGTTYVCTDREFYDYALEQFKPEQEFIIQAAIDPSTTVEVSTEGWFNGVDFIEPFNHTFEEKKFMPGDLGEMSGCMGNIVVPLREATKLVKETVMKMVPVLKKAAYRGPLDVNCLVTKDAAYVLEFTPRFGYDAIEALMCGMQAGSVGGFLFEMATGIAKSIPMTGFDFLMAVNMSHSPYPIQSEDALGYEDGPVLGVDSVGKDVYLAEVYKKDNKYFASGGDGIICKVVAHGRDVRETQRRCYDKVDKIRFMNPQYRVDIGDRVEKDMKRLKEWGWI